MRVGRGSESDGETPEGEGKIEEWTDVGRELWGMQEGCGREVWEGRGAGFSVSWESGSDAGTADLGIV